MAARKKPSEKDFDIIPTLYCVEDLTSDGWRTLPWKYETKEEADRARLRFEDFNGLTCRVVAYKRK